MSLQTRVVLILDASSGDSIITTALQMQAGPQASLQARSVTGPALIQNTYSNFGVLWHSHSSPSRRDLPGRGMPFCKENEPQVDLFKEHRLAQVIIQLLPL